MNIAFITVMNIYNFYHSELREYVARCFEKDFFCFNIHFYLVWQYKLINSNK